MLLREYEQRQQPIISLIVKFYRFAQRLKKEKEQR